MGDYFQSIVRIDALPRSEIESAALHVMSWVVDAGILARATHTSHQWGQWAAGPRWRSALDEEPILPFARLSEDRSGSVDIDSSRAVHDAGQWWGSPYLCPSCGHSHSADEDVISALYDQWISATEPTVHCPECGASYLLNDWVCENPSLLVGGPAITFWNWPNLSDQFMADLDRELGGRTRWIYGKR